MKRLFADKRPIGPFVSSEKFTELGFNDGADKEIIGQAGTSFPYTEKEDLHVIYVLKDTSIFQTQDFASNIQRKINGRNEYEGYKVEFLKSGTSSKKQFKEQAVKVVIPSDDIATTRSDLDRIQGIIERQYENISGSKLEIEEIIYEMVGTP